MAQFDVGTQKSIPGPQPYYVVAYVEQYDFFSTIRTGILFIIHVIYDVHYVSEFEMNSSENFPFLIMYIVN